MKSLNYEVIIAFLKFKGFKKNFQKQGDDFLKFVKSSKNSASAKPKKEFYDEFNVVEKEICGARCFKFSPKTNKSKKIIIYIHGGGYFMKASDDHFNFLARIIRKTNAVVYFPDYPLAPDSNCDETNRMILELYSKLIKSHDPKDIVFMGDSAGGGISLVSALCLKEEGLPQAGNYILISPSVDLTTDLPITVEERNIIEKSDPLISFNSLDTICDLWRGNRDKDDFHVTPIHGDLSNLGKITIFAGTRDILTTFSKKLVFDARKKGIDIEFNLREGMIHCYPLFPIDESKADFERIVNIINE